MDRVLCLLVGALVCLCVQRCSSARVSGQCSLGGRYNDAKLLIRRNDYPITTGVYLPCRYRMLNVHCSGVDTEVFADNSYDSIEDLPYTTGVFVNITTVNNDNSITYQQLFLNNVTFKAYLDAGNFNVTPWQWSYAGSPVDADKKVEGHYDQTTGRGVLVSGGLTVTFLYVGPYRFRRNLKEQTLYIYLKCQEETFSALDGGYPKSLCGMPNNTYEDMTAIQNELTLDFHHKNVDMTDFLFLAKQNAKQPDPVCQEAVDIGGSCSGLGEKMYACRELYDSKTACLLYNKINPFKLYVTCLRFLCNTDNARTADTCTTLQTVTQKCGAFSSHVSTQEMLSAAGCPSFTTPAPAPTTTNYWYNRYGGPQNFCLDRDRTFSVSYYGFEKRTAGRLQTFFQQSMEMVLPCRYKMANIRCGGQKVLVLADRATSVDGYSYVSGIIVKIQTTTAAGKLQQTNKLSNDQFKAYLEEGDYSKRLWRWSYSSSDKPRKADRIIGHYNQSLQAGVLTSGHLTVTYLYMDPLNATRPGGDLLTVRCDDPKFKSLDVFPDTLCGSPSDHYFKSMEGLREGIVYDPHHQDFGKDLVFLDRQKIKQPNKLCKETADVVKSGSCERLGDKLYICHQMLATSTVWSYEYTYHQCVVDNQVDIMKFFTSCLRILCATANAATPETCQPLQQVYNACGDLTPKQTHTKLSDLLAQSDCQAVTPTTTTV